MGTKSLWLPQGSEIDRDKAQLERELDRVSGEMEYWTRELQQIDPDLRVFMARPQAENLRPGFYYVVRLRPGFPAAVIEISDEETGEWLPLGSHVLDMIQKSDLWNDRTQREMRANRRRIEEARQRDKIRRGQDRAAEFNDRLYHATHATVSIPRSIK